MSGSDKPDPGVLAEAIVNQNKIMQNIEKAILTGLENFAATADQEITKLLKSNTLGPDVGAEMTELKKAVIKSTIAIIEAGSLNRSG